MNKFLSQLTSVQKNALAIIVPIVLFIIFWKIAERYEYDPRYVNRTYGKPFNLESTWFIWIIYVLIIGFFEVQLFNKADPKDK